MEYQQLGEQELLGLDIVHLLLQAGYVFLTGKALVIRAQEAMQLQAFCEIATDSQLTQLAEQCMVPNLV